MVIKKKNMVLWEKAKMPVPPDYVWPWSTWVALRRRAEEQSPHNMTLLMQHAYARYPVVGCWKVKKVDADPRETEGPRCFIQRKFIPRNYVARQREIRPNVAVPPRFIMPRFKNIPPRVDDRWDKCPLDASGRGVRDSKASPRRLAVCFKQEDADAVKNIVWKKTVCGKCHQGGCQDRSHRSLNTSPETQGAEIE